MLSTAESVAETSEVYQLFWPKVPENETDVAGEVVSVTTLNLTSWPPKKREIGVTVPLIFRVNKDVPKGLLKVLGPGIIIKSLMLFAIPSPTPIIDQEEENMLASTVTVKPSTFSTEVPAPLRNDSREGSYWIFPLLSTEN
ncbi:MAG: hypothetical protein HZB99_00005 [Candidatus Harrisonbacteria bacterium]|nr:hypothetical protein [Candidatus Harrisonbacteria bacterium]